MRVLVVEDESSIQEIFRDFCGRESIALEIAGDLAAANEVIGTDVQFDLVVCDLKIPTVSGSVDEDIVHGLSVVNNVMRTWPGVPIVVLSAFGTLDVMSQMLLNARQEDVYGRGDAEPMLRFEQKANVRAALAVLSRARDELGELAQIEVSDRNLAPMFRQALQIYARRRRGSSIEYRALSGGLSGARTGLATVRGAQGESVAHVVAKLTRYESALEEADRYRRHVAGRLGAGTYADQSDQVLAGCGDSAALFYSVASSFDRDLFTVIGTDDGAAARVVARLKEVCRPWLTGVPQRTRTWVDVRRTFLGDAAYEKVRHDHLIENISGDTRFQAVWASQHGDLHGANVLVDQTDRPVLIDYGRAQEASAVMDPLTLELSPLFHPDSPLRGSGWPSVEIISSWDNLDAYLKGCPYPEYIRACRSWTLSASAGLREVYANVAALSLRNLRYDDVDQVRALALQRFAARALVAQY